MREEQLEVLKADLAQLKETIRTRKDALRTSIQRNTFLKKTSIGWIARPISLTRMQLMMTQTRVQRVKPSRREAPAAVLTLSRHVADPNEPFACKLEVILVGFGRRTCLDASNFLRPTALTDFLAF